MTWTVEWDDRAARELRKLDRQIQKEILAYFRERIATAEDPRRLGRPLFRELAGLWRYRVRDHRLICNIEDGRLVVTGRTSTSSELLAGAPKAGGGRRRGKAAFPTTGTRTDTKSTS